MVSQSSHLFLSQVADITLPLVEHAVCHIKLAVLDSLPRDTRATVICQGMVMGRSEKDAVIVAQLTKFAVSDSKKKVIRANVT